MPPVHTISTGPCMNRDATTMSRTTSFTNRLVQARQVARVDRKRQFQRRVLAALVAVLAVSPMIVFLSFGEELRCILPESTVARVGCNWVDNLSGGFVAARSLVEGTTVEKVWNLADAESVRVVDDPGPSWNPAREVTVTVSGSPDPARVRRWSLRLGGEDRPRPVPGWKPINRDSDPLAPNLDRESQRQQEVFLQLR